MWYVRRNAAIWSGPMAMEYFDVLIMGAGLSGIDAAHHLQKFCPNKSYIILEQRERIGGTWDLFRYRHPFGLGHADHGLFVPPVDETKGDFSGGRHPRLHRRHRARCRHRPKHPLRDRTTPR